MNYNPALLPDKAADAARHAADILFSVLSPGQGCDLESPGLAALRDIMKMLNALSGGLDGFRDVPDTGLPRAQWYEALLQAEGIANRALTQIAAGLTPEQAAGWLEEKYVTGAGTETMGTGGTIELIGPDVMETDRTLTVAIGGDRLRTLAVTVDRGPTPEPRLQTPATLLRTWHHLNQLAAVLGDLVLEPLSDGIPLCRSAGAEVTCESCGRTADGDTARAVELGPPPYDRILVCSIACARTASTASNRRTA